VTRLPLFVTAGAKRTEVIGTHEGGEIRLRLSAPATEGKANRELIAFLARSLDLAPSRITLVRGSSSRHKLLEIDGMTSEEVLARLLP
jgi:uncharacterized protein (TIGR00251 family)